MQSDTRAFASFIARVQWRSTTANTQLALFQNANRLRTACRVGISADAFPAVLDAVEAAGKTIVANGAYMRFIYNVNRLVTWEYIVSLNLPVVHP